jgi:hypothetical protein
MLLIVPLALFLLIPLAITLAVPARYYGFYVAWVAMLAITFVLLPSGPDHSSPLSGMGNVLYLILGIAIAVTIGIKSIVIELRRPPSAAQNGSQTDSAVAANAAPVASNHMPWAVTGVVTGFCGIITIALALSAARPAWIAHAAPFLLVGGALALAAWCWKSAPSFAPRDDFTVALAASAVVTAATLAVWIYSRIDTVVDAAEALAADKPYCIQVVALRAEFEPAAAKLDFSPLTMRARCSDGWCWQNHAILAVDDGSERMLMNWSHRRGEFRSEVLNASTKPPAIICRPERHFARGLPWL